METLPQQGGVGFPTQIAPVLGGLGESQGDVLAELLPIDRHTVSQQGLKARHVRFQGLGR